MTATLERRKTKPPAATAPRVDPPAASKKPPYQLGGGIASVPLSRLVRHPQNRAPTAAQVQALAASIADRDQLEPIVVRLLPDGHPHRTLALDGSRLRPGEPAFQIVSGETRSLACLELDRPQVAARILEACDDAQALILLAEFNAARDDLNPIQKARLIEQLCRPAADGGGGLTRKEAARIYGLESHAGASNLVRLLELPEAAQRFVEGGQLPQSFARDALAHFAVPAIADALCEEIGRWDDSGPPSRDEWHEQLDHQVLDKTRTLATADKHGRRSAAMGWYAPSDRLFAAIDDLPVVQLPVNGKLDLRTTDVARWEERQKAACAQLREKETRRRGNKDEGDAKPKSAADQKALEKEQDEQLAKRIARWRHAWLRELIVVKLRAADHAPWISTKLVMWCLTKRWDYRAHDQLDLVGQLGQLCGVKNGHIRLTAENSHWGNLTELLCRALLTPERQPDWPVWPFEFVDQLAEDLEINLGEAWRAMQSGQMNMLSGQVASKEPLETFLGLHNQRQLRAVAQELGVSIPESATKGGALKLFMHLPRVLLLPKSIALVGTARKSRRPK